MDEDPLEPFRPELRAHCCRGREAIAGFLAQGPFTVTWRHLRTSADGRLAVACYAWDPAAGAFTAYALDVLQLRGDRIPRFGVPPAIAA